MTVVFASNWHRAGTVELRLKFPRSARCNCALSGGDKILLPDRHERRHALHSHYQSQIPPTRRKNFDPAITETDLPDLVTLSGLGLPGADAAELTCLDLATSAAEMGKAGVSAKARHSVGNRFAPHRGGEGQVALVLADPNEYQEVVSSGVPAKDDLNHPRLSATGFTSEMPRSRLQLP